MNKYLTKIKKILNGGAVRLKSKNPKGDVLLSYITDTFLSEKDVFAHSNHWECKQMAKIFLAEGYNVDVVNWNNKSFVPRKKYSFVIDIHCNLERWSQKLDKNCIKILHLTGSHWIFQNHAEYKRLLSLKNRRNVVLVPRRQVPPSFGLDVTDFVTMLGGPSTEETYNFSKKPIFKLSVTNPVKFEKPINKLFSTCSKNFVWIGGAGLVHKGLDLVLEAFTQMPEYNLTVCGPIDGEKDFKQAYYKELFQTKNIKTVGWVDVSGEQFKKITNDSVALVYPSCSEGQAGSVVVSMAAGLIPIVSKESGVDVKDVGFILKENSIEEIVSSVKRVANMSFDKLNTMTIASWQYSNTEHSRKKFKDDYEFFVKNILKV